MSAAFGFPMSFTRISGSVAWTETLMGLIFSSQMRSSSRSERFVSVI